MVATRNPLQLVREAKQIAKDHGLRVAECPDKRGTVYVVYRKLPDGKDVRLGRRSTPRGIHRFVSKCAGFR